MNQELVSLAAGIGNNPYTDVEGFDTLDPRYGVYQCPTIVNPDGSVSTFYGPGLGFTPDELTQLQQQVQAAVNVQANAALQKLSQAAGNVVASLTPQIKEYVTTAAKQAGVSTRDEVKSALIKTAAISIIGGGILGGVLGLALAKKFR